MFYSLVIPFIVNAEFRSQMLVDGGCDPYFVDCVNRRTSGLQSISIQHTSVQHMSVLIPTGASLCHVKQSQTAPPLHILKTVYLIILICILIFPFTFQHTVFKIVQLLLFLLQTKVISCCLLYCEIVLWLFNWASLAVVVYYYALPNGKY